MEGGFVDRRLELCVRDPATRRTKRVPTLDWQGLYSFRKAYWTSDSKALIVALTLVAPDSPTVFAFACDFDTGRPLLPSWQSKSGTSQRTPDDWRSHETQVRALIETHGGLQDGGIDHDAIRRLGKRISTWQAPPGFRLIARCGPR
jgi:hypothetical protein